MTWEILVGIITLVGFIISVIGPIMKLTKVMTELTVSVTNLKDVVDQMGTKNSESHKKIWDHIDEQDKKIDDHEKRLTKTEYDIDKFHGHNGYTH